MALLVCLAPKGDQSPSRPPARIYRRLYRNRRLILRARSPGLLCGFCSFRHSSRADVWAGSWMAQGFLDRSGTKYGKTGGESIFPLAISMGELVTDVLRRFEVARHVFHVGIPPSHCLVYRESFIFRGDFRMASLRWHSYTSKISNNNARSSMGLLFSCRRKSAIVKSRAVCWAVLTSPHDVYPTSAKIPAFLAKAGLS